MTSANRSFSTSGSAKLFDSPESPVLAIQTWASNAELIADCARLGYLREDWRTLDCTYGYGTFWNRWQPRRLVGTDIDPNKNAFEPGHSVDFTKLPFSSRSFDAVVFDPPYKLNGAPDENAGGVDERFGVHKTTDWRDRMQLIRDGLVECERVLGDGYLLLKCQDQVCSGKVRWQTIEFTNQAFGLGLGLVDRFDFLSYRPQPNGRRQVHARRNASTLLVFKRGWSS